MVARFVRTLGNMPLGLRVTKAPTVKTVIGVGLARHKRIVRFVTRTSLLTIPPTYIGLKNITPTLVESVH